jgi:hypothetical protein
MSLPGANFSFKRGQNGYKNIKNFKPISSLKESSNKDHLKSKTHKPFSYKKKIQSPKKNIFAKYCFKSEISIKYLTVNTHPFREKNFSLEGTSCNFFT